MKSLSKELLDRAVLAMVAAIEIYNKPKFPYRNESFAILAINAWELLVKAKWLEVNGNKKRSLYVYDHHSSPHGGRAAKRIKRTRSGAPFTHEIGYLTKQLVNRRVLDPVVSKNIDIMLEFRDCATHFYNKSAAFDTRLYEIGAACVKNFVNIVREWFRRDVTEFDIHLMPLATMVLPAKAGSSLLNAEQSNFVAFLDSSDEPNADPEHPYSVSVTVELKFIRTKARDAMPVQVTNDPSAPSVKLTEENILEKYPWDYAKLTEKCRQRYRGFKVDREYHKLRKRLEIDNRFARRRFLDPGNVNSAKKTFFNPNIMTEFDKHYSKEPGS